MKMEVWSAPIKTLVCPERFSETGTEPGKATPASGGCDVTYEMHGDMTKLRGMFEGMIVRMKYYQGDKVVFTQDLREYSTAKLDDSLFTVPDDYKEVSSDEYNKAQMDDMKDRMMHGGADEGMSHLDPATSDTQAPATGGSTPSGDQSGAGTGNSGDQPSDNKEKPKKKWPKLPGGMHLPF